MTPHHIISQFLIGEVGDGLFAADHATELIRVLGADGWAITKPVDPTLPIAGQVGRAHPGTSSEAAADPVYRVLWGSDRANCVLFLYQHGPQTCAVVGDHFGIARNQTATRMKELRKMQLVDYLLDADGKRVTRPTGPRSRGEVQYLTQAGRVRAEELVREGYLRGDWDDWKRRWRFE